MMPARNQQICRDPLPFLYVKLHIMTLIAIPLLSPNDFHTRLYALSDLGNIVFAGM